MYHLLVLGGWAGFMISAYFNTLLGAYASLVLSACGCGLLVYRNNRCHKLPEFTDTLSAVKVYYGPGKDQEGLDSTANS
jgi:hypothetical protein